MKGFHTQKNLFFERLPDGGVRVTKYPADTNWLAGVESPSNQPLFVQELDADAWCSVIASMSAGGGQDDRFRLAGDFHKSVGARSLQPPPYAL